MLVASRVSHMRPMAYGAVSVEPRPVRNRISSPQVSSASALYLVEHVLRHGRRRRTTAAFSRLKKFFLSAASFFRYGSSIS